MVQLAVLAWLAVLLAGSRGEDCGGEQPCVQACCPPGQVWTADPGWREPRCGEELRIRIPPPEICLPGNISLTSPSDRRLNYSVIDNRSPGGYFSCPRGDQELLRVDHFYMNNSLRKDGWLEASHPGVEHIFPKDNFCIIYTSNGTEEGRTFRACSDKTEGVPDSGKDFTFIFYPTALLVSSIFLLLTLLVYIIDPDLHRPLFGKITLGFVVNNLIAYICLIGSYLSRHFPGLMPPNSLGCIIAGYVTLYTFTTFMFWINAMAANIFFKFSSIMNSNSDNDSVKFVFYSIYAQGAPLLLCLFVLLMDSHGPCDMVRPNMGVAHCFLGTAWADQMQEQEDKNSSWALLSFMRTSEFLYFHSVLIGLQVMNLLFFLGTVHFLVDHWRKAAGVIKSEVRANFLIVLKLIVIMGIPWLGEIISHVITHNRGPASSFALRLAIDLLNLLTGVLVFLVLVCKKKTLRRVVGRLRRDQTFSSRGSTLVTRVTKDRFRSSTMRETRDTREGLLARDPWSGRTAGGEGGDPSSLESGHWRETLELGQTARRIELAQD